MSKQVTGGVMMLVKNLKLLLNTRKSNCTVHATYLEFIMKTDFAVTPNILNSSISLIL